MFLSSLVNKKWIGFLGGTYNEEKIEHESRSCNTIKELADHNINSLCTDQRTKLLQFILNDKNHRLVIIEAAEKLLLSLGVVLSFIV